MKYKKWKIGFLVAIAFGLLTAGAGLAAGITWQQFVAILCTSLVTQLGAYLMKHPVEEISDDPPPFRPTLWIFAALVLPLALSACKTPRLEPGGAYAQTNAVGQVIYSDGALAVVDASYKLTYNTALAVFTFERDNRQLLWDTSPKIKHALDELRPQVVAIDRRWALARKTYRSNPTPQGMSSLQEIIAEIQRLLPVIQEQLNPIYEKITTNP